MFDLNTEKIKDFLQSCSPKLNAALLQKTSGLSSFKAGGKSICAFFLNNTEELCSVLSFLKKSDISFYMLGSGTNTLFADGFIDVALIKLSGNFDYLKLPAKGYGKENIISAGAACSLGRFVVDTAKHGFDFSFLAGIPGTLGGAVAGNAGNVQYGICKYVKSIRYAGFKNYSAISLEKKISVGDYGYRAFGINGLAAITDIYLTADPAGKEDIFKKIRHNIKLKKSGQPLKAWSAGCFFKNPAESNYSSGEMIDICGLKGFRYGGARVSPKHANFLENYDKATGGDIYMLSKIVREFVRQKFKINLEYEVKLIGF